jgi:hypothetical protein
MHSLQDLVLFFLPCTSHACQRRHDKVPGVAVLGSHCGCIFLQIMGKLSIARWVKEKMWGTKLSFLAIRGADKLVSFHFWVGHRGRLHSAWTLCSSVPQNTTRRRRPRCSPLAAALLSRASLPRTPQAAAAKTQDALAHGAELQHPHRRSPQLPPRGWSAVLSILLTPSAPSYSGALLLLSSPSRMSLLTAVAEDGPTW